MSALARLWLTKQKATIRNLFRKPSSAIFTVLMVLIYGFLIVALIISKADLQAVFQFQDAHITILYGIGFGALFVLTMLLQKRKALFYEDDSFYLFSGPFSRKQVMGYLMAQSFISSFMFSLICLFMMLTFGSMAFTAPFLLLSFVCYLMMFMFWLNFTDYLYILSITNDKYKKSSKILAGIIIGFALLIFLIVMAQNNFDFKNGLMGFAQSPLFYVIPVFGWIKLALISYLSGNVVMTLLGVGIMLLAFLILTAVFVSFKGDFYEKAMQDSIEVSSYVKGIRSGKQNSTSVYNAKVKKASISFRSGAGAIYSKNILLMKKTGNYLRKQDIFILIFYFIISLMVPSAGFGMYVYMLVIWVLSLIQDSDMMMELKNYQIYLIPDSPFKKLMYVILPTMLKIVIVSTVAVVGAGLFYRMGILEIFQYVCMLWGYAFVFICASVLSVRILKSRSNMMMENLLRMLIMVIAIIPAAAVTILLIIMNPMDFDSIMAAITVISLIMNFVISFVILLLCKNMMNGRELNSD